MYIVCTMFTYCVIQLKHRRNINILNQVDTYRHNTKTLLYTY